MTTPDYRALCAELVEQLQRAISEHGFCLAAEDALMHRARTALAQPEPEGPSIEEFVSQCRPLDDETLALLTPEVRWRLYDEASGDQPEPEGVTDEASSLARELREIAECCDISSGLEPAVPVLTRAADLLEQLAQPEPEGPSERIASIATAIQECAFGWEPTARLIGNVCAEDVADLCTAVLARWGRPALRPVPVSERLPGPEDCGPKGSGHVGCCWQWEPDINGHEPLGSWNLQHRDWASDGDVTHWISHHALPVPEVTP